MSTPDPAPFSTHAPLEERLSYLLQNLFNTYQVSLYTLSKKGKGDEERVRLAIEWVAQKQERDCLDKEAGLP